MVASSAKRFGNIGFATPCSARRELIHLPFECCLAGDSAPLLAGRELLLQVRLALGTA